MASLIIAAPGGVMHMPLALAQHPDRDFTIYHRCSSWGQAGKGKQKLFERSRLVMDEARRIAAAAPGESRLKRVPFYGIEEGKMSNKRPSLQAAAQYAHKNKLILIAADLSRFIRAEAYCKNENREARPTEKEFVKLRELTLGVPLATIVQPTMSEAGRQRLATKRSQDNGRPRTAIPPNLAWKILLRLGSWGLEETPNGWQMSLSDVAKMYGVSRPAVARLLDSPIQDGILLKDLMRSKDNWPRSARKYEEIFEALGRIYKAPR